MRFTSSRRSAVACLLFAVLSVRWAVPPASATSEGPEAALFLKYAAPDIPESVSREILDPVPGLLSKSVRVRFVPAPAEAPPSGPDPASLFPVPGDAALRRIAGKISKASAHMEKVENDAAEALLSEAEKEARAFRFTESTLPFLAEIYLREGILKLRKADLPAAESLLARSRALRPGFNPDPALFPPQLIAAWERARRRPLPEPELLVQSLPSGAGIEVDGEYKGKTPSRIRPGKTGPVKVRVFHKGYRDAVRIGQWLPGDAETLDFALSGDRVARLGELLGEGAGREGKGTGPLIDEFASAAGVSRIAVMTLEKDGSGEGYRARAYARSAAGGDPVYLGEKEIPAGSGASEGAGKWVAAGLLGSGWPAETEDRESKPWYKKWWVWGALISGVGIAAALAAGGGSGGGGGGSSVAVSF
ncbi:MAG: PEGA domain-containing protein [Thermodesulfobacteriota bacterium]